MTFAELNMMLKRLHSEFGLVAITVTEDGERALMEAIEPYTYAKSTNTELVSRIGNVFVLVQPKLR